MTWSSSGPLCMVLQAERIRDDKGDPLASDGRCSLARSLAYSLGVSQGPNATRVLFYAYIPRVIPYLQPRFHCIDPYRRRRQASTLALGEDRP